MSSTTNTVTYFGRRAAVTVTKLDRRRDGRREVITRWLDDADERNGGYAAGTVVRKVVVGDGRTNDFAVLEGPSVLA